MFISHLFIIVVVSHITQRKGAERNRNFMLLIKEVEGRRRKSFRERFVHKVIYVIAHNCVILRSSSGVAQSNSEEGFVDKSRNIGVTSGEKDLKLQVKRKKTIINRLKITETQNDYKSLCKLSKQLMQISDYKNSLHYLNMVCETLNISYPSTEVLQAVEAVGEDHEAFILRTQCNLKLCLYKVRFFLAFIQIIVSYPGGNLRCQ